jgi:hypothetical protein
MGYGGLGEQFDGQAHLLGGCQTPGWEIKTEIESRLEAFWVEPRGEEKQRWCPRRVGGEGVIGRGRRAA